MSFRILAQQLTTKADLIKSVAAIVGVITTLSAGVWGFFSYTIDAAQARAITIVEKESAKVESIVRRQEQYEQLTLKRIDEFTDEVRELRRDVKGLYESQLVKIPVQRLEQQDVGK